VKVIDNRGFSEYVYVAETGQAINVTCQNNLTMVMKDHTDGTVVSYANNSRSVSMLYFYHSSISKH